MGRGRLESTRADFSRSSTAVGSLSFATSVARSRLTRRVRLRQQRREVYYRLRLGNRDLDVNSPHTGGSSLSLVFEVSDCGSDELQENRDRRERSLSSDSFSRYDFCTWRRHGPCRLDQMHCSWRDLSFASKNLAGSVRVRQRNRPTRPCFN
jgi:hypothetical protein